MKVTLSKGDIEDCIKGKLPYEIKGFEWSKESIEVVIDISMESFVKNKPVPEIKPNPITDKQAERAAMMATKQTPRTGNIMTSQRPRLPIIGR